jgi:hypothetical protein
MFKRSIRAAVGCLLLGCSACTGTPNPPVEQRYPEGYPGAIDANIAPGVNFRAGGGYFWGGGWGDIQPGPTRPWLH